jgi:hypothetical protein
MLDVGRSAFSEFLYRPLRLPQAAHPFPPRSLVSQGNCSHAAVRRLCRERYR